MSEAGISYKIPNKSWVSFFALIPSISLRTTGLPGSSEKNEKKNHKNECNLLKNSTNSGLFIPINPLALWRFRSDPSNMNPYNNRFGCCVFVKFWLRSLKVAPNLKTSHLIGLEKHKLIVIFHLIGYISTFWYSSLDFSVFLSLPFLRYFHK